MRKTYVLDTNILLHSPFALLTFKDNEVIIPDCVLEELDNNKRHHDPEIRANVRMVGRMLDELRCKGSLYDGVTLENGGILKIELNSKDDTIVFPENWELDKVDNRILALTKSLQKQKKNVALVSKDIFLRVKGDALKISIQDYTTEQVADLNSQYSGYAEIEVADDKIDKLFNEKTLRKPRQKEAKELIENQYVLLKSNTNAKKTALGRYSDGFIKLIDGKKRLFNFDLTVHQKFARDALLDTDIPLVTISGPTGSGKTLLGLAGGLEQTINKENYRRILICRPLRGVDEEIGTLPGDEQQKIGPYMRPILDNLEQILGGDDVPDIKSKKGNGQNGERYEYQRRNNSKIDYLFEARKIEMEAIMYIQGRSIQKHYILIDEAQNLTPKQAKSIVTRAGLDTKVVLVGDPDQINHPYLDSRTNGLSWIVEKMKGSRYHAHITLPLVKRSPLVAEAEERMRY